jgi:cell division septation protein DedD
VETAETKTKTKLEFYEELKKSGPVAPDPPRRNESRQPKEKTPREQKVPAARTGAKKSLAKPAGQSKEENPRLANAAVDRPSDNSRIVTIQAASLKDLAEADALVKKLKHRGYPAYKTIAVVPGKGIWFRIRVGRYSSREAARDVVGKMKKEGYRPILVETN